MDRLTLALVLILLISSCFSSEEVVRKDEIITPTLMGHWTLDGDAKDKSPFKSHGKIYGNPKSVKGIVDGRALDFDGDDYIQITQDDAAPPQLRNLSKGAISLWFKARSWDVENTMLPILYYGRKAPCLDAFDATNEGFIIEVGHGGIFPSRNVFYTAYDKSCAYPTMCFDSNDEMGIIEPEKWYHFVVVIGENYNTGFLNGQELVSRRYNFDSDTSTLFFDDFISHERMWIGKGYWKSEEIYFDGLIDDVRIYDRPLGDKEVKLLYHSKI